MDANSRWYRGGVSKTMKELLVYMSIMVASIGVVSGKDEIYKVVSLLCVYVMVSIRCVKHGVEYVGMLMIVVYIGAIGILIIFIVMMMSRSVSGSGYGWYVFGIVGGIEGALDEGSNRYYEESVELVMKCKEISNVESIGCILYGERIELVLVGGLVLLVGLVGGVLLGER